uniref:Ground-like domain-containing protein n=1 Tax=Ascaris lumbricoides TaxID=6252 RepID=A0A0M3HVH5_ASCLU
MQQTLKHLPEKRKSARRIQSAGNAFIYLQTIKTKEVMLCGISSGSGQSTADCRLCVIQTLRKLLILRHYFSFDFITRVASIIVEKNTRVKGNYAGG